MYNLYMLYVTRMRRQQDPENESDKFCATYCSFNFSLSSFSASVTPSGLIFAIKECGRIEANCWWVELLATLASTQMSTYDVLPAVGK